MRILAVGAHFDDVELGGGGSLLAWRRQGHEIVIFTACRSGYHDPAGSPIRTDEAAQEEGRAAAATLGARLIEGGFPTLGLEFSEPLNKRLLTVCDDVRPDLLLTHWSEDTHTDHRALGLSSLHCARRIPRVLAYCSNWYVGTGVFDARFFVDIGLEMDELMGLLALYESEDRRTRGRWREYRRALGRELGLRIGVEYAEAFQVIKWLHVS